MDAIKLIDRDGFLYWPFGDWEDNGPMILMRFYPAGDCDTCPWPHKHENNERLALAVFDAFETTDGAGDHRPVMLPDGTLFDHLNYLK